MRQRELLATFAALSAVAIAVACGGDTPSQVGFKCSDFTVPGVVINSPGIQAMVRTIQGQPAALGASLNVTYSDGVILSGYAVDSLTIDANVVPGTYTVRVSKPGYRDTTVANVVVHAGECNSVATTKLSIALQPLGGAPSVRSVGVAGAEFLATPGSRAQLVAFVDADSGLSHAVTWRLSDTTMATIDDRGVVTAKCSAHGGSVRATATSVVDGAVSGSVSFGIGANERC